MTPTEFRRLALAMKDAIEGAHMGHPDFRVDGRIFCTLWDDNRHAGLMLTPEQQADLLKVHPDGFEPAAGSWGRAGSTIADLPKVDEETIGEAITLAWQNAVAKGPTRTRRPAKRRPPSPK